MRVEDTASPLSALKLADSETPLFQQLYRRETLARFSGAIVSIVRLRVSRGAGISKAVLISASP
jgi:hypothetical protein